MVTRTLTKTPFGFRLAYSIDGEALWTEYVTSPTRRSPFKHNAIAYILARMARKVGLCP